MITDGEMNAQANAMEGSEYIPELPGYLLNKVTDIHQQLRMWQEASNSMTE
jgi:hypothetical protein